MSEQTKCPDCGRVKAINSIDLTAFHLHGELNALSKEASDHAEARAEQLDTITRLRTELAEQVRRVAELEAMLHQAAPMQCVYCGPHVKIDEDGCCVGCGAEATEIDKLEGLETP